jgi:frataxin
MLCGLRSLRKAGMTSSNILNNNMNDAYFTRRADATLGAMLEALEPADQAGKLDVDYQGGVMTIELANGRQFIISKHAPTRQLWLSSPVSGGLHFSFDPQNSQWKLADGRSLSQLLAEELRAIAGIEVVF